MELPAAQTVVAPIEIDVSALMTSGENHIEMESDGRGMMSVHLVTELYIPWDDRDALKAEQAPNQTSALQLSVRYSRTNAMVETRSSAELARGAPGIAATG